MAINYTTNYNLKKPDGDEFFNINDANNNMDLIDTTIKSANDAVASKVDKVTGKALSTNDYTTADKTIVGNVTTNLNLKADKTTVNSIITSLDFKVDKVTGKMLSDNNYTTAEKTIVGNVTTNLSNKVDKITGKGLSANDYTDSAKAIVDGVTAKINTNIDNIATNATNIASNLSAIGVLENKNIKYGTYTGDGTTSRIITVPDASNIKMVMLMATSYKESNYDKYMYIGRRTLDKSYSTVGTDNSSYNNNMLMGSYVCYNASFIVDINDNPNNLTPGLGSSNDDGATYMYLAFEAE